MAVEQAVSMSTMIVHAVAPQAANNHLASWMKRARSWASMNIPSCPPGKRQMLKLEDKI